MPLHSGNWSLNVPAPGQLTEHFFQFPFKHAHMFFSLESAQSPALWAVQDTKTSTVGLNLPFSKICPASFEQNKAFCVFEAKMVGKGEPQGIKSTQLLFHCNLEIIPQPSVHTRDDHMELHCIICFKSIAEGSNWEQRWMFMPVLLPVSRAGRRIGFFPLPMIKDSYNMSIVCWFTLWASNIFMIFIKTLHNEQGEYTGIRKIPFEFKMWLMAFLWKWKNRGLLRERAGQEEKNALKIRCREEIREVVLPQDCAKHRHKQMPVVAMFCFLNQPDHRTSSVTGPCESTEAVKNQSLTSTRWYQQQHPPHPRQSQGQHWHSRELGHEQARNALIAVLSKKAHAVPVVPV